MLCVLMNTRHLEIAVSIQTTGKNNKEYLLYCDVEFYSDLKRLTSRSLSSVEGCYVECVLPRAVWHLKLHKINPSQDSYFGCMTDKQTNNNVDANSGLDWPQTLVRGCQFTFTTKFLVLPTPSDHGRTNF